MEKQILSFNDLPSALSLVINKLEILEEKFSTLMTQIQPDKGLEWLSVSELSEYLLPIQLNTQSIVGQAINKYHSIRRGNVSCSSNLKLMSGCKITRVGHEQKL